MTELNKTLAEECREAVSLHISDVWDSVALVDSALAMVRETGGHDNRVVSLLRMASERLHMLDKALSPVA